MANLFYAAQTDYIDQLNVLWAQSNATLIGSSVTPTALGTGVKTLTTQPDLSFILGNFVLVASAASVNNYMIGQVVAYDTVTGVLDLNVATVVGSGTFSSFVIAGSSVLYGGTLIGALNEVPPVTKASAANVAIGAALSNQITITGTTTITSFDSIAAGAKRVLTFSGAVLLTHNTTSLALLGGSDITTAAGDIAEFVSLGSGTWLMSDYVRKAASVDAAAIADAKAVVVDGKVVAFRADLAASTGAGLMGWIQSGVGAVFRWIGDKLRESVSVWDFIPSGTDLAAADCTDYIQAGIEYAAANNLKLRICGGTFRVSEALITRSNLHMTFDNGAWILPYAWNAMGGVLTNVDPIEAGRVQTNILIENPQFDGINLPTDALGNSNAIGFARGASKVRVIGGVVKNFPFSWSAGGAGGKAVNFESGVVDSMIRGVTAENCGVGVFVQGKDGAHASGESMRTTQIIVSDIVARNCECAIAVLGINTTADPDGDADDSLVVINGVTFYNCGHSPNRPVVPYTMKSGAIVFGEGQNVQISNVKGHNTAAYTSMWPASGSGVVGAGLTGPIGAVIWGWGRNITARNIEFHGDCDALIHVQRARALGDDAAASGTPLNVFRLDMEVTHFGTATYGIAQGPGVQGPGNDMTGRFAITTDVLTTSIVGPDYGSTPGVLVEARDSNTNAIIVGSAPDLVAYKNTFAGMSNERWSVSQSARTQKSERFLTNTYLIADDAVLVLSPVAQYGTVIIASETSLLRAHVGFRCTAGGAQTSLMTPAISNFAITTGALTGTTATDGNFTFSADNAGNIYFENRRGGAVTTTLTFLG